VFHRNEILSRARTLLFQRAAHLNVSDKRLNLFAEEVAHFFATESYADANVDLEYLEVLSRLYDSLETRWPMSLQQTTVANVSFAKRFAIAIASRLWHPDLFMATFRDDEWTMLVMRANEEGKTALHWAARLYGSVFQFSGGLRDFNANQLHVANGYRKIAIELVRTGSDVHSCWNRSTGWGSFSKTSPLLSFLQGWVKGHTWCAAGFSDAVYRWGQMLLEAGLSLSKYAATENVFLRGANCHAIDTITGHKLFFGELGVSAENKLTVRIERTFEVTIWKARSTCVPGAWPSPTPLKDPIILLPELPYTTIWQPEEADEQHGFHWAPAGVVNIRSHSSPIGPPDDIERTINMRGTHRYSGYPYFNRDDHDLSVVTMTSDNEFRQGIKIYTRRRSASVPTINIRQRIGRQMLNLPALWGGTIHQCVADMRWKMSSMILPSLRDCLQGRCRDRPKDDSDKFWERNRTWEMRLLGDEDHVQVAKRFAQRFCPHLLEVVEGTSTRATERAQLAMGPARPPERSW
jgi:hypothetical protein